MSSRASTRHVTDSPNDVLRFSENGEGGEDGAGPADKARKSAGDGHPLRILVVEDEWFVAVENEATLLDAKYDVVGVATNAEDALAIAEATRPDLVLMDIRLPGKMDGIEIAAALRERFDIPSVFVTAHSDVDIRRRAEPARPRGWLVKPFTSEQLLRVVAEAFKRNN